MKVYKLIEHLKTFDPEMEVLYRLHSDYAELNTEEIKIENAVNMEWYHMRSHPTMALPLQQKAQDYLVFPGN